MRTLALRCRLALVALLVIVSVALAQEPPKPAEPEKKAPPEILLRPPIDFNKILDGTSNTLTLSERDDGARLGAMYTPVNTTLFRQLKLNKDQGLVVQQVKKDGLGAKAGLEVEDILLELGGKPVPSSVPELEKLIASIGKDKTVELIVLREGKRRTLKVEITADEIALPSRLPSREIADFRSWEYRYLLPYIEKDNLYPLVGAGAGAERPGWKVWAKGDPLMTTTHAKEDRFTTRQQEGSLVLTVHGTRKDGKVEVAGIKVQDGSTEKTFKSVDKVPAEYRDKVSELLELSGKP